MSDGRVDHEPPSYRKLRHCGGKTPRTRVSVPQTHAVVVVCRANGVWNVFSTLRLSTNCAKTQVHLHVTCACTNRWARGAQLHADIQNVAMTFETE